MKKTAIFSAVAAAVTLTAGLAFANEETTMEKCNIVDKSGKGLIKEHKADCKGTSHSCAGQNKAGDAQSWISVPKGQCDKVRAGDFSGISKETKDKIEGAK